MESVRIQLTKGLHGLQTECDTLPTPDTLGEPCCTARCTGYAWPLFWIGLLKGIGASVGRPACIHVM